MHPQGAGVPGVGLPPQLEIPGHRPFVIQNPDTDDEDTEDISVEGNPQDVNREVAALSSLVMPQTMFTSANEVWSLYYYKPSGPANIPNNILVLIFCTQLMFYQQDMFATFKRITEKNAWEKYVNLHFLY